MKKGMHIFAGVAAAAALGSLVWRLGVADILAQLRNLRVALPVVLAAGLLRLLLQTRAWQAALRAEGIDGPQSRLLGIRLASQAAGYLAALGPVVSEPAKLVLLRNASGMSAAAPATLMETGAYWFTTVILGLAGTCAAAFLIGDARVVGAAALVFGAALVFLVPRCSLLSPLVRAAGRRAPGWLRAAETAELRIRSFRDRKPRAAAEVLALDSAAQVLTLVEVWAVLWVAGLRPSVPHVLAIEAAGRMVKVLGAFIPGRIGADEGGAAASCALLGFPPAAGLMLAVARRVRDLLWCGAGIVWAARTRGHETGRDGPTSAASLCMEER